MRKIAFAVLALAAATGWGLALAYYAENGDLPEALQGAED